MEEKADHLDCLQTGGTGYPISTVHLPKSAMMPLKSITESLEREVKQDLFSRHHSKTKESRKDLSIANVQQRLKEETF